MFSTFLWSGVFFRITDGILVVLGGNDDRARLADVEMLNLTATNAVQMASQFRLPEVVLRQQTTIWNGTILTCGGEPRGGKTARCDISLKGKTTKKFPSMNHKRTYFGMITMNETVTVIGGDYHTYATVELYDENQQIWVNKKDAPVSIYNYCILPYSTDEIILIGGHQKTGKRVIWKRTNKCPSIKFFFINV